MNHCPFSIGDYVTPIHEYTSFYGSTGKVVQTRHGGSSVDLVFPGESRALCYGVNELKRAEAPSPPHPVVADTLSKLDEEILETEVKLTALKAIREAVKKVRL